MEARYRMRHGEFPTEAEEWRLPHSPLPARPDYTRESRDKRLAMTERVTRKEKLQKQAAITKWDSLPDLVESADKDHKKALAKLSFNIGQLETLPPLVAAALFHQSVQQPNTKAYVPFVSSAPVHSKTYSETEKRSAQWQFPGFCSGCSRQELCYGCVKDPFKPHYHGDKPVRTGGGYTYYKRDKPEQHTEKAPHNWRNAHESPAYIHYDGYMDFDRYDITMRTGNAPIGDRLRDLNPLHDLLLRHHSKIQHLTQSGSLPLIQDQEAYNGRVTTTPLSDGDSGRGGTVADSQENLNKQDADKRMGTHSLIQEESSRDNLLDEDKDRNRLYQAPKAFTPKKKSNTGTVAKSPFSTDRKYDIQTGDGFNIHKSDKDPTKFQDFDKLDRTWNEPTKFELTDAERKAAGEWTAPKPKSPEKATRSPPEPSPVKSPVKTPPKEPTPSPPHPEERPVSADSGVDSQPLTARSDEPEPTKFEIALPPIPQTPSAPASRAQSVHTGPHSTRPQTALTVEGEGQVIHGDTPASLGRKSASTDKPGSKERTPVRSAKSSAKSVVIQQIQQIEQSPDIPPTIESPANTTVEAEPNEETPPPPPVVEQKSPTPQPPTEPTPEPPKPEVDWSKFRSGAIHYTEEEDHKKKEEEEARKRKEEEERKLREEAEQWKLEEEKRMEEERLREIKEDTKKKKEVAKKELKQSKDRKKPKKKQKLEKQEKEEPEPEEPEPEIEPEVLVGPPPIEEVHKPRTPTPPPARKVEPPPLPNLEPPSPPALPEYGNPERPTREISKTAIEAPPQMPEPPKQRRPADLKRVPKRKRDRKRVLPTSQSVAPVSKGQLKTITDPLDYLAKYCIIHPDRLPHYERVFNQIISEQVYRYNDVPHHDAHPMQSHVAKVHSSQEGSPENKETTSGRAGPQSKTGLSAHERKMIDDMNVITRATNPKYGIPGMNEGDQLVAKINFTLDLLIDNYENLQDKMEELHTERVTMLASMVREEFPNVAEPNYKPGGKKKKKKKKGKEAKDKTAEMETQTESEAAESELMFDGPLPDAIIVQRLDNKMLAMLESDPSLTAMNAEITRLQTKLQEVDDRIEDLEDEKKVFQIYARDLFTERHKKPNEKEKEEFMRRQSALYRKLHPNINAEMNLTELEEALQQLNQHLISEKEMQYIYHVLDIDGRRRIDIQLFSVIAALSEKVAQVDPFIRKLINKFDFEALDVKMEKSKELFDLLDEDDFDVPAGMIKAKNLVIALAAGGVAPENTDYVESKFNREKRGIVDFLDFLTYVPLFIEIHQRIIAHPLSQERLL